MRKTKDEKDIFSFFRLRISTSIQSARTIFSFKNTCTLYNGTRMYNKIYITLRRARRDSKKDSLIAVGIILPYNNVIAENRIFIPPDKIQALYIRAQGE